MNAAMVQRQDAKMPRPSRGNPADPGSMEFTEEFAWIFLVGE
jgi:hypothetical protein